MLDASIEFISQDPIPAIHADYIETIDHEIYPVIVWDSPIEKLFSCKLRDKEKAQQLYAKHQQIIGPILQSHPDLMQPWKEWLNENHFLLRLGSAHLINEIKEHPILKEHQVAIAEFLKSADEEEPLCKNTYHKIVIIAPLTISVAENKIAQALEKHLCSLGKEVKILCPGVRKSPLYLFAKIDLDDVWCEIVQKRNDWLLAMKCWDLFSSVLPSYIQIDTMGDLWRQLESFSPDFVITTQYGDLNHAIFSTKYPMAYLICDYFFLYGSDVYTPYLLKLIGKVPSSRVKIWAPSKECIPEGLKSYVDVLGYPIRDTIQKVNDIGPYLEKWSIDRQEKVVLIQMGSQGVGGSLPQIIENLYSRADLFPPLHLIALTGNNQAMKEEVELIVAKFSHIPSIKVRICGALEAQEMGELYNITDVMIGKAGGSTTAEILRMNIPSLVFPTWDLEKTNVRYLVDKGLGIELKNLDDVAAQLKVLLDKERVVVDVVDWKEELQRLLP